MTRSSIAMLFVLGLVGCATTNSTGQIFLKPSTPDTSNALLYVFRLPALTGSLYVARFELDGMPTGNLGNGEYFVRSLNPGRHVLKMEKSFFESGPEHEVEVLMEPGTVHYVQYAITPGDIVYTGATWLALSYDRLVNIPPADAVTVMNGLKEVE